MLCSGANHIHTRCLSLGTLYAFQCRLHSWTEKGVGVASLLLSHFYAAVWLTLQPGRGIYSSSQLQQALLLNLLPPAPPLAHTK